MIGSLHRCVSWGSSGWPPGDEGGSSSHVAVFCSSSWHDAIVHERKHDRRAYIPPSSIWFRRGIAASWLIGLKGDQPGW